MFIQSLATSAVVILSYLFVAGAAVAQDVRYIRTDGSNTSQCTLEAPCKTLVRALTVVPAGGEIRLLDSGNFGNGVVVTKSVTIIGDGNTMILAGNNAINVNNGLADVVLRGLLLRNAGGTTRGILISKANTVSIAECEIDGFVENGILMVNAGADLAITDTFSRNNGASGLEVRASGANRVVLNNFHAENNSNGFLASAAQVDITGSTFAGNTDNGIRQTGGTMTINLSNSSHNGSGFTLLFGARMQIDSSLAVGNDDAGISVSAPNSIARISNLTISGNAVGIRNGERVETYGNSTVTGNDADLQGNALVAIAGH